MRSKRKENHIIYIILVHLQEAVRSETRKIFCSFRVITIFFQKKKKYDSTPEVSLQRDRPTLWIIPMENVLFLSLRYPQQVAHTVLSISFVLQEKKNIFCARVRISKICSRATILSAILQGMRILRRFLVSKEILRL